MATSPTSTTAKFTLAVYGRPVRRPRCTHPRQRRFTASRANGCPRPARRRRLPATPSFGHPVHRSNDPEPAGRVGRVAHLPISGLSKPPVRLFQDAIQRVRRRSLRRQLPPATDLTDLGPLGARVAEGNCNSSAPSDQRAELGGPRTTHKSRHGLTSGNRCRAVSLDLPTPGGPSRSGEPGALPAPSLTGGALPPSGIITTCARRWWSLLLSRCVWLVTCKPMLLSTPGPSRQRGPGCWCSPSCR